MSAPDMRCGAKLTRYTVCDTVREARMVEGRSVLFCATCDRRQQGRCITCDAPVDGTPKMALYCAPCRRLAQLATQERYRQAHRAELAARDKVRLSDPVRRAKAAARGKLHRFAMPGKTAQHARATYERRREKVRAYSAAYRAAHGAAERQRRAMRAAGVLPPRTCVDCPTVMTGRAKRCAACRATRRTEARALLAAMLERAAC